MIFPKKILAIIFLLGHSTLVFGVTLEDVIQMGESIRAQTCAASKDMECANLEKGLKSLKSGLNRVRVAPLLNNFNPCNSTLDEFSKTVISAAARFEGLDNQQIFKLIDCFEGRKKKWQAQCEKSARKGIRFEVSHTGCVFRGESVAATLGEDCKEIVINANLLGEGAFKSAFRGFVYGTFDEFCILKFKKRYETLQQREKDQLDQEIEVLNDLKGRSLVGLPRVILADKERFAMEKFDSDLWDLMYLGSKELDQASALQAAAQLTTGLRTLHEKGLVHGDIKTGNAMVSRGKLPKQIRAAYIDFGLSFPAKKVCEDKKKKPLVGTPGWVPPELMSDWVDEDDCEKSAEIAQRGDVFAHAGIVYALLNSQDPPWVLKCGRVPTAKCIESYRSVLRGLKQPLSDLIADALDPNPLTRMGIAEFEKRLEAAAKASP